MVSSNGRTPFLSRLVALLRSPLLWALVFLWLVLFAMETMRPCYFLHDDNAAWFLGAYLHDYDVLADTGRLAEVNYYQHGGEPFLQQGQTAVLYPPIYLGVALAKAFSGNAIWSIDWIAAEHLTLGLLGFYFWLRQGGVAARWAAMGALAWVLNPFVLTVGASWITATFAAAWLPWLFWAFDRLLAAPSLRAAIYLGASAGLFFLQGYVQWFAYAILFLGIFALLQFMLRPGTRRPVVFYHLFVAAIIFAILSLPLLLPMLHAVAESALRPEAIPLDSALEYSVPPGALVLAQLCLFQTNMVFGLSTIALYCPALLLVPAMILRLIYGGPEVRRRLLPLICLGLLALLFSTSAHVVLSMLPLFDKFRWPFKVFLYVDFFLVASLVWTATAWAESRSARWGKFAAGACLGVMVLANPALSFAYHDESMFSKIVLPGLTSPLPPAMDSRIGRVVTFADSLSEPHAYRYLSHAFATTFAFPSLGGYDPLVGEQILEFSYYLDFPNYCRGTMTPDFQRQFEARAVRYWIVHSRSSQLAEIERLPGLKLLDQDPDRLIFEDTQAEPLVHSVANPTTPCTLAYSGNSLVIPIKGIGSSMVISLGPTDGWWYRLDGGPWLRPVYRDGHVIVDSTASARLLEVTYFDARFRLGLLLSAGLLLALMVMTAIVKFRK